MFRGSFGEVDEGGIVQVVGNAKMLEVPEEVPIGKVAGRAGFPEIVGFQAVLIPEIRVVFFHFIHNFVDQRPACLLYTSRCV